MSTAVAVENAPQRVETNKLQGQEFLDRKDEERAIEKGELPPPPWWPEVQIGDVVDFWMGEIMSRP